MLLANRPLDSWESSLVYHAPPPIIGFAILPRPWQNQSLLQTFTLLNLMKCGMFSNQKKENLDHQSRGSLHRENYRLGTRWS